MEGPRQAALSLVCSDGWDERDLDQFSCQLNNAEDGMFAEQLIEFLKVDFLKQLESDSW